MVAPNIRRRRLMARLAAEEALNSNTPEVTAEDAPAPAVAVESVLTVTGTSENKKIQPTRAASSAPKKQPAKKKAKKSTHKTTKAH